MDGISVYMYIVARRDAVWPSHREGRMWWGRGKLELCDQAGDDNYAQMIKLWVRKNYG